jgi:hypothetical protein
MKTFIIVLVVVVVVAIAIKILRKKIKQSYAVSLSEMLNRYRDNG